MCGGSWLTEDIDQTDLGDKENEGKFDNARDIKDKKGDKNDRKVAEQLLGQLEKALGGVDVRGLSADHLPKPPKQEEKATPS